jgi:hypothetical protein
MRCTCGGGGIAERRAAMEVDKTDNEDKGSFAESAVSEEMGILFGRRGIVRI